LDDDAGHHLRHVDFSQALEEHHERLRAWTKIRIVEKRFRIDALVVQVLKALVAAGNRVVNVRLAGMKA